MKKKLYNMQGIIQGSEGMNNSSSMNTPYIKEDIQVLYLELVKLPHL